MNFRNLKKENLRALNDQLSAEIPEPSDDEILEKNFQKIDAFSNVAFLAMSDENYELRVEDAKKINGRRFLMVEITKQNLPNILNMLRNQTQEESIDSIFDKNLAKLNYSTPEKERNQDFLTQHGISKNETIPQMSSMINSFENKGFISIN